ncbi:DUF6912 family protein [Brachybacterium sp. GCM10030267]|uniref:DUF6912 family protein n=1 Tax=unclassified Brachybacterium TaxID=2623841 RepID=UPI0036145D2E
MRIYLPLTTGDRRALESAGSDLELAPGRAAWAVTTPARADRPDEDEEDLEYEALQDAVHVAFSASAASDRALVIAADVPDRITRPADEEGGAFGIVLSGSTRARIASLHVTELDAASAEADDTDPALLWFDASEGSEALAFLDGAADDGTLES